ncbi:N-acetylmuramoyl-L-alanine amidase [Lutibacter sp.]|uniref:N-acetylmuramoyl-L-alanine amidase family protein n=1 Tax=Lutibacter sp. TaxID=1925666 RepID=UPI0025B84DEF|nr:N-acetylmuramoyl-L-alanine amidase [Lutibacter sp.]MCF6168026.1 N-acetylmuramoyl-L-alanine amidase [Lutibacter sp.]
MNSQLFSKINITTKFIFVFVFFSTFFSVTNSVFAQKKDFIVVLDAGHGGKDPGKVGYKKSKEKEIALKIVLQIGKLLEKEKGIKVIYTRKTDVFVDLWERGRIANKADANLFVSIHCNAHNSQAYGAETWVLGTHANKQNFEVAKAENAVILLEDNYQKNYKGFDPNSPESVIGLTLMQEEYLDQSIQLASIIQKGLTKDLKRKDRGVKQAGFVVLHQTYMPSVLIETGFITNKIEGPFLNSKIGQQKFSREIYKNILKYIQQLNLNTVKNDRVITEIPKKTKGKVIEKKGVNGLGNVVFKVQIASGSRKLETKPYNFKGLKDIERVKVGKTYKYYLGLTQSYSKIKELQKLAKSKGFRTAFIVAFKNGKKIPVNNILKKT